jgi:hypothetical protein
MTASPSITNYQIPTGKVYFLDDDNTTAGEVDLGNVVNFKIGSTVTKKDHFRSYGGQRTKDKTVVTAVDATVTFVLDEITKEAVGMFALGTVATVANTDGSFEVEGLTRSNFTGVLHVVGDNDIGPQLDWIGRVSFSPSGDFFFIQDNDNWNQITITADVSDDVTYGFGKWTVRATGAGL